MEKLTIDERFKHLEAKLFDLVHKYHDARKELDVLRSENRHLKDQLELTNDELKSFKNQEKITKIVDSVSEGGLKSVDLKQKINEYIKEIDRCIAHLSE